MRPEIARASEPESFSQSELQWRHFSDETKARLEALNRALTERRQDSRGGDNVVELLQDFERVRESFLTMTLPNGEAIAQRSADLLAAVREGRAQFDDPLLGLLQRVADRLKDMRAYVVARRKDAPPAIALTAELDLHRAALGVGGEAFEIVRVVPAPVNEAPPSPAQQEPAPVGETPPDQALAVPHVAAPAVAIEPPAAAPIVHVRRDVIDGLMAQIGDMRAALSSLSDILHDGAIGQVASGLRCAVTDDNAELETELRAHAQAIDADLRQLRSFAGKLEKAHRHLWDSGLRITAVPVEPLLRRLARSARDVALTLGKDIDVGISAAGLQVDRSILDALADPLMQLARHAIEHGLESPEERVAAGKSPRGRLTLVALEIGSRLQITIGDDGRGIDKTQVLNNAIERGLLTADDASRMSDREIYGLLFAPTPSAAGKIEETLGATGRLDIAGAAVRDLGGSIEVRTMVGCDSHIVVEIPLSAVLLRSLLVRAADQTFAMPDRQVVCVVEAETADIHRVDERCYYRYRDVAIPLHRLDRLLGFEAAPDRDRWPIVILSTGTHLIGVVVEEVLRLEDLYLTELHPMLAALPAVAGSAVLGSGRAVLVLEAKGLLQLSRAAPAARPSLVAVS